MRTTVRGHADDAIASAHIREATAAYRGGTSVHHFFDLEEMTSYESSARIELTHFAIRERAHVASAIFIVRSKLVAMGVSTAALAARLVGLEFVVLHRRADFERRIAERLATR